MTTSARAALLCGCLFALSLPAVAQTGWNEATQGDLANSGLAPTTIAVTVGDNLIRGQTGSGDRDYLTFTVPAALSWTGLQLLPGSTFSGSVSFLGLQAGPRVTVSPQAFSAAGLLGWVHYGDGDIGSDLLPVMADPRAGSSGFTLPLPGGSYSLWLQDTGGQVDYALNLQLSAVPEPAAPGLLLAGVAALAALAAARQRRR